MIEFIHNFINYNLYNAALVVIATYALLLGIVTLISLICVATIVRVAFSPHIKVLAWSNHTLRSGIERLVPFKDKHIFIFIGLTAFFILFFVPLVFKVSPEIGMFFLGEEKSLEGLFAPAAAAFSGIAFFLMFCTFRSQEKQLKHVAQESKGKSFETVFFNLLNIHRENYSRITTDPRPENKKADAQYFRMVHAELKKCFSYQQSQLDLSNPIRATSTRSPSAQKNKRLYMVVDSYLKTGSNKRMTFYKVVFEKNKYEFTPYFRHYYHILKYLHSALIGNEIPDELVFKYRDILKAQITPFEHAILYYNGLYFKHVKRKPGYYNMIMSLSMLDDIDVALLFDKGRVGHYPPSAFGNDELPNWECYND